MIEKRIRILQPDFGFRGAVQHNNKTKKGEKCGSRLLIGKSDFFPFDHGAFMLPLDKDLDSGTVGGGLHIY